MVARLPEFSRGAPHWFAAAQAEHKLSGTEKLTFLSMCALSDPDLMVSRSQREIAEHFGISPRSVQAALVVLVDRAFIVDTRIDGPNRVRLYRISFARPLPPAKIYPNNVRDISQLRTGPRRAAGD